MFSNTRKAQQSCDDFLNPDKLRSRLISASIFIAGFEVLKDVVVGRIRGFFFDGIDVSGDKFDPKYQSDVLSLNSSPVYASLEWPKNASHRRH